MRIRYSKAVLAAAAASLLFATQIARADDPTELLEKKAAKWAEMCDTNKDGMVSKAEMMKMVEKAWAKADPKNAGRLDKKQVMMFMKEFQDPALGPAGGE
jgi:Ca2+-binding EF-hand superfamily protein